MMLTPSPAIEKRVRAIREKLNAALANYDAIEATGDALENKTESLATSIATNERTLDPLDDDAVLRLTAKKSQLAAVEKKLAVISAELGTADQAVRDLYGAAVAAVGDAHRGELAALRAAMQTAIADCFGLNSPLLAGAIESFPRVRQLDFFCSSVCLNSTPSVDQARRLLTMMDAALEGHSSFEFTPE